MPGSALGGGAVGLPCGGAECDGVGRPVAGGRWTAPSRRIVTALISAMTSVLGTTPAAVPSRVLSDLLAGAWSTPIGAS